MPIRKSHSFTWPFLDIYPKESFPSPHIVYKTPVSRVPSTSNQKKPGICAVCDLFVHVYVHI